MSTLRANTIQAGNSEFSTPVTELSGRIIKSFKTFYLLGAWVPSTTYSWLPGGFVDYIPERADTRIRFSISLCMAHTDGHAISHNIFYANSVEIGRHSISGQSPEHRHLYVWDVASWGAFNGRIGYQMRAYAASANRVRVHSTHHWDGAGSAQIGQTEILIEEYLPLYFDPPVWATSNSSPLITWTGGSLSSYDVGVSAVNPDFTPVTYSIVTSEIPNTTINSTSGVISSTGPNIISTSGVRSVTVRASNSSNSADRTFSINIIGNDKDGSTSARAAPSAAAIKELTLTNVNGVYWINLPTVGPRQIFCIMDSSINGGGWMMMLKATRANTFAFLSSYWTTANVLNEAAFNQNDGDAKFEVMNRFAAKDMLALWPDLGQGGSISAPGYPFIWLQNDFYGGTRIVPITFWNTVDRYFIQDANNFSGIANFSRQTDVRFYGFNYRNNQGTGNGTRTRWGFGWNENGGGLYPNGNMDSDDVAGGIGMNGVQQNTGTKYSAGDVIGCCQNVTGMNRSARVELYVR
jgi:hypothetical protein